MMVPAKTGEPKMIIIGLAGFIGAGKDTVGLHMVECYGFHRLAFADGVRTAALALDPIIGWEYDDEELRLSDVVNRDGWNEAKKHPEVRRTLQRLGTEVGRQVLDESTWIRLVQEQMRPRRARGHNRFVITDTRFVNEAEWIMKLGGEVWRIVRPDSEHQDLHVSEREMAGWPEYTHAVLNDGTISDLHEHVDAYLAAKLDLHPVKVGT